jgi:Ca2+/Na+ antiporter
MMGSSFFITSAVIPLALRAAENGSISVTPTFFLRDIFFFVLVYLYLYMILFFVGYLNFYISFGFLMIYIIYVFIVVIQAKASRVENEENEHEAEQNMNALDFLNAGKNLRHADGTRHHKLKLDDI